MSPGLCCPTNRDQEIVAVGNSKNGSVVGEGALGISKRSPRDFKKGLIIREIRVSGIPKKGLIQKVEANSHLFCSVP